MDPKSYYEKVTAIDIGSVAKQLFGERITEENSQRMHVDCPHHASESQRSLHVDLAKGLWNCFGCQAGGDVIQLVEFIQTGQVTKGVTGVMTDSHRQARDFLGEMIDLPPMRQAGLSEEEISLMEQKRADSERVFASLTSLAELYHQSLLDSPEIMEEIKAQWGFDERVIRDYKIGWANLPDAMSQLKAKGIDVKTALSTGAFVVNSQEHPVPFFQQRIVFPYWSRGRVVYMIGRRTKWTHPRDRAKYKKLQVHHPELKKYVSPCIDNSLVFGEDVLSSRPKAVSITEGITDGIATQVGGFPCISPVTVGFKKDDIQSMVRQLRGVGRVYLVQDNEFSGIGMKGALSTARIFGEAGIETLIGLLPVPAKQAKARKELDELMGEDLSVQIRNADPSKRAKLLEQELPQELHEKAKDLRDQSKIDLCEWWQLGGTPDEYQKILDGAKTVMEVAISQAPKIEGNKGRQIEAISDLLTSIGMNTPAVRDDLLRQLKSVVGISLSLLRSEAARFAKKQREEEKAEGKDKSAPGILAALSDASAGSLKEMLSKMVQSAQAAQTPISWERMGTEAYEWFRANGGIFFRSYDGVTYLYFESRVYCMMGAAGQKQIFEGLMFKHSGLVPVSAGARTFFSVLRSLAAEKGDIRELPTWINTVVEERTVYVNLNNAENQIVTITPEGYTVAANGVNPHRTILQGTSKFEPVVLQSEVDHLRLEEKWRSLIGDFMATDGVSRQTIFAWAVLFPMIEYAGIRPMLRLEGEPGSGKTWAAKMLTTFIFGDDQQKKSTTAANYVDASANPMVALDNVEMSNVTQDLIDFLLTVVTGIRREKRRGNTDTDTISEKPMALVMSTGVEPLGGDLAEIMSRSFVISFFKRRQGDALIEREVLQRIKENRNALMAMCFGRCARVFQLIDEHDAMSRVMVAITKQLGAHSKRRCNEFLALMYLVDIATQPESRIELMLDDLNPSFGQSIIALNEESDEVARESSSIGVGFSALFTALRAGGQKMAEELGLSVDDTGTKITDVATRELYIALTSICRARNLPFPYKNSKQFGRRLGLEVDGLAEEGFTITFRSGAARKRFFSIRRQKLEPTTDDMPFDYAQSESASAGDDEEGDPDF